MKANVRHSFCITTTPDELRQIAKELEEAGASISLERHQAIPGNIPVDDDNMRVMFLWDDFSKGKQE